MPTFNIRNSLDVIIETVEAGDAETALADYSAKVGAPLRDKHWKATPVEASSLEDETGEKDVQRAFFNPSSQVYFRAGLLAARESLARFVESESPTIANSIRLNWWPRLGIDPGCPRLFKWDEIADELPSGYFRHKPIDPSTEALPLAHQFLSLMTSAEEVVPSTPLEANKE